MPRLDTPTLLPAYASDTEGVYIFNIVPIFDACIIDPIAELDYDLQIDVYPTFGSPNSKILHKGSGSPLSAYVEGNVAKTFEVILPGRARDSELVWYYRARVNKNTFISDWTETKSLVVPQQRAHSIAQEAFLNLADEHVYPKEASSTNVYRLLKSGALVLDQELLETRRVKEDTYLDTVRDSAIVDNFGSLYKHPKAVTESFGDYRNRIRVMRDTFLSYMATEKGIKDIIKTFVVQPPTLTDNSDLEGWILGQNYLYDPAHPELTPYAVLYSRISRGFGFTLRIFNSWGITFDQTVLENLVLKTMPRHAKAVFQYPTQKPTSYCLDIAEDWNTGNFVDTIVVGNSLALASTPATPEIAYDGSAVPSASSPAWVDIGLATSEASVGGVLQLTGQTIMYQCSTTPTWSFNSSGSLAILKTNLKMITAPSLYATYPTSIEETFGITAVVLDATLGQTLTIGIKFYSDGIYVEGSDAYAIDTTDDYHTYEFMFSNDGFVLHVDGNYVHTFPKGNWSLGDSAKVQFGINSSYEDVTVYIDYLNTYGSSSLLVTSGTWTSPVVDGHTLNAWSYSLADINLNSGDTCTIQLRSSPTSGGPWTSYQTLTNNALISGVTEQEFFQVKITFTAGGLPRPSVDSLEIQYERG